jgi:hypothetical protein
LRKLEEITYDLEAVANKQPETPAAFAKTDDESAFVATINESRQRVDRLLDEGVLLPISESGSEVRLDPGEAKTLYVVLQPADTENYSVKLQNRGIR